MLILYVDVVSLISMFPLLVIVIVRHNANCIVIGVSRCGQCVSL
uniref:Uncharacterized protein n=1 Tax=Arundo donax TaxID=35708 RepID=A0A0A9HCV7_ARUDO